MKKLDESKGTIDTARYRINFEEISMGGPGGYESVYLTSEADPASKSMYDLLDNMEETLLPVENRMIRQRNGQELVRALKNKERVGIASGFKPSGAYHFGHKLTSSAVSFFQKNGAQIFVPVADLECLLDTGKTKEEYSFWAADNLVDWGANGVDLDAAHVYLQSEEKRVEDLAFIFARGLTFKLAVDTYGLKKLCGDQAHRLKKKREGEFPFLFSGMTQVADIVLPQHYNFGNKHSFMLSGQDQDGHMKMTIELLKKSFKSKVDISGISTIPSGFYIPHIRGLTGKKQSSSRTSGTLYLGPGKNNLDLEDRTKLSIAVINEAFSNSRTRGYAEKGALDMVRYIDFFNNQSIVNFPQLVLDMPKSLLNKLENELDDKKRAWIIDNYLIKECKRLKQENIVVVRDNIAGALRDHQAKRQKVIDYAKEKREYSDKGVWDQDNISPSKPEFWNVPKEAVVDPSKRNKTQWYHIVTGVGGITA
jgi:tryptophanyl-tRNA synthetase